MHRSKRSVPASLAGGLLLATFLGALLMATPMSLASNAPLTPETSATPSESLDLALTQARLNRQIEQVLENPEFNWRKPYSPAHSSNQKSVLDQLIFWAREAFLSIGNALNRVWKSLLDIFNFKRFLAEPTTSGSQLPSGIYSALTYLLWTAFAGTLILFALRLRKLKKTARPKPVAPPPMPDLADDGIAATQLPDGEWSALARQKIAAGEFRQALRAFFLAILALLASRRLIAIERWKSNSDYEKELRRKANSRSELLALFAQSRLGFERSWYGADSITPEDLENYHGIYERIKHAATDHL